MRVASAHRASLPTAAARAMEGPHVRLGQPLIQRLAHPRIVPTMRLIQHKREAYWFYRFLSLGYDRWVNPLFWTPAMRTRALAEGRLDGEVTVLDVGAGTGFTTEGIVERIDASRVTMLDQSPHQLARSRVQAGARGLPARAR